MMDIDQWVDQLAASALGGSNDRSAPQPRREKPDLAQGETSAACDCLNRLGVRIMDLNGTTTIGVWSDLDSAGIRTALATLGIDSMPVRYLDGSGIPLRYKVRRIVGEPVPANVLAEMEQTPDEPWTVRDRMLTAMGLKGAMEC
jgi:hypothetical protein